MDSERRVSQGFRDFKNATFNEIAQSLTICSFPKNYPLSIIHFPLIGNDLQTMLHPIRLMYQFLPFVAEDGYMAHLTAGLGDFLAINMYKAIFYLQYFLQALVNGGAAVAGLPDEVDDGGGQDMGGIAQGIIEHDAPEHIKLGRIIGFDGVVAAVVYPWGRFVYKYFTIGINKHFYGKYAGTL